MRPLAIALAASLILTVAACGGNDGAKSAGRAPSVAVETALPVTSSGDPTAAVEDYFASIVEYVAQADAICKTATDKLEATLAALPEGADMRDPWAYQDLYHEIAEEALAELRALPLPEAPLLLKTQPVIPVALCSHRGGSQQSASGPTRAEFIAQAREICRKAEFEYRTQTNLDHRLAIMEETLAQLRALPQPEADRALLEQGFYEILEQEIYNDREAAAAESAGDYARMWLVGMERYYLKLQRGAFVNPYGLGWCIGRDHD